MIQNLLIVFAKCRMTNYLTQIQKRVLAQGKVSKRLNHQLCIYILDIVQNRVKGGLKEPLATQSQ